MLSKSRAKIRRGRTGGSRSSGSPSSTRTRPQTRFRWASPWALGWAMLGWLVLTFPLAVRAEGEAPPTFADVLDVRVVNLEVVVTARGERVQGLGSEDFRLEVDGKEVPIEYFSEIVEGRATDPTANPGDTPTPAVPAVAPGEAVGTRYLVFVDDFFAIPSYRNRVLRELADQLPLLKAEDRMAIVAFDGRQVDLLSSWTRSLAQLETALDQARERPGFGLQRLSELRVYDSIARFEGRTFGGSRFSNIGYSGGRYGTVYDPSRGIETSFKVHRVIDGATSALRAFARPQGRKVMLLLSGGWPIARNTWIPGAPGAFGAPAAYGSSQVFAPLIDTANRLGYTLYPVDLSNDQRNLYGSAEHGSLGEAQLAHGLARERDWISEDGLLELAEATGGEAFLDGAAYSALERATEDTRSYYWIGFTPDWQLDDSRHDVRVEVEGRRYKVRAREGFFDLSRQSEVTLQVESAQLFDLPLPGRGLEVSLGEPSNAGFKKVLLPLRLTIPLTQVTLLPSAQGHSAQLELRVAATDDDGNRADIPVVPVQFTVASDAQGTVVYDTQLELRRKPHRLLVSLYDPVSGETLSTRLDVSL